MNKYCFTSIIIKKQDFFCNNCNGFFFGSFYNKYQLIFQCLPLTKKRFLGLLNVTVSITCSDLIQDCLTFKKDSCNIILK